MNMAMDMKSNGTENSADWLKKLERGYIMTYYCTKSVHTRKLLYMIYFNYCQASKTFIKRRATGLESPTSVREDTENSPPPKRIRK